MHNSNVLGDEGRKALNACVKVKIYDKSETRRYDRRTSLQRLRGCHAYGSVVHKWWYFDELVLPPDKHGNSKSSCNIIDIHDALVNFDKRK